VIRLHLSPNELGILQTTFRTTPGRRLRDRAQIILLAQRGRPHQAIAEDLGISARSVQRWLNAYLEHGLDGLQPRRAKGRQRVEQRYPGIAAALEVLLSDELALAGSPEGEQKWVRSSAKNLSQRLRELGFNVGRHAVAALLRRMGFSMKMNFRKRKGLGGDPAPREEQFRYMKSQRKAFREAGMPMISVDTKKKELIGNFRTTGRVWCRKAPEVDEYDFASQAECVAVPYGVYDMTRNTGYVVVGLSHNTPEFAVSTIARWWQEEGRVTHGGANRLLIFADGGGGNGSRARAWKLNLQDKLCDACHLTVTVCHYPPGCSKWNPIEYRLFSQISKNWEGKPLRTLSIMLGYIRGTTTTTGLTVKAYLDEGIYRKGRKVTRGESDSLNL
jgi:transposase